jgi:hypothetical protein
MSGWSAVNFQQGTRVRVRQRARLAREPHARTHVGLDQVAVGGVDVGVGVETQNGARGCVQLLPMMPLMLLVVVLLLLLQRRARFVAFVWNKDARRDTVNTSSAMPRSSL